MLSNTVLIPGINTNIFIVTQSLQECFQVTPEGDILTLKKSSTEILFDGKITNIGGKLFILTTNFYKRVNEADFLVHEKRNPE